MIYLDNAATSFPKPRRVLKAMYLSSLTGANPGRGGHSLSVEAGETVFNTRQRIAALFGTEVENVVFTKNCTEALNTAVKGCLKKGDHAVISSLEHNSLLRPIQTLAEKGIITYDVAKVFAKDDDRTVKEFESLIKPETKLIACCHVSNVFGTVLPIERIGKLCRRHGLLFAVDAAQSAGAFAYDLRNSDIDFLCMPGHKGLLGPMGTGVLILSGKASLEQLLEGGTGSLSLERSQPSVMPDKFESGTLNLPGIAGLGEGIKMIEEIGTDCILKKEAELTSLITSELKNIRNITVYDNMHARQTAGVISFNIGSMHSEEVGEMLNKMNIACRAGYHCSALAHEYAGTTEQGVVRVSPGLFNNRQDIKNFIFCTNKIAMGRKIC